MDAETKAAIEECFEEVPPGAFPEGTTPDEVRRVHKAFIRWNELARLDAERKALKAQQNAAEQQPAA
ncbi:MAG: hypothetical protein KY468_16275 [Armatimonadetes bacterium]|nr:hypothetical protein [Armatimonadota bacterium]